MSEGFTKTRLAITRKFQSRAIFSGCSISAKPKPSRFHELYGAEAAGINNNTPCDAIEATVEIIGLSEMAQVLTTSHVSRRDGISVLDDGPFPDPLNRGSVA